MIERRVVQVGAIVWSVVGASVALTSLSGINSDARVLVGVAAVAFPLAAAGASTAVARRRDRTAGLLLLVSVATPTYFAWVLNLPALLVGLALLVAPNLALKRPQAARQFATDPDTDGFCGDAMIRCRPGAANAT